MFGSSFNLSQSFNYTPCLFYKKGSNQRSILSVYGPRDYLSKTKWMNFSTAYTNRFTYQWEPQKRQAYPWTWFPLRRYDMKSRSQMQGGKNWILPKEVNANLFFWDSHWMEIWKNTYVTLWDRMEALEGAWLWTLVSYWSGFTRCIMETSSTGWSEKQDKEDQSFPSGIGSYTPQHPVLEFLNNLWGLRKNRVGIGLSKHSVIVILFSFQNCTRSINHWDSE